MHACRQEEGDQAGRQPRDLECTDSTVVDMPQQEVMDGAIPVPGKLIPGDRIPPVGIESTVCEPSDFGQCIELMVISNVQHVFEE